MGISDFEFIEELGKGSYSTVYKVERKLDGQFYALKKIKFGSMTTRDKQNALNEIRILASLNHPNIVTYKEAFIDEGTSTLCLIMEYAEKGDLLQSIQNHKKNNTRFTEEEIWKITNQALKGLKALHDLNILHRDIKSANMFILGDSSVQLGDLNVSKVSYGLAHTQTGTPYYASPEIWKDQPYDSKSDIWSLGCVIYELAALEPPFKAPDMKGLYRKVVSGKIPQLPLHYSADLNCLIKLMINVVPGSRPTCEKLLEMPIMLRNVYNQDEVEILAASNGLMETIRLPPTLRSLKTRLPAPNYTKKRNLSAKMRTDDIENYGKFVSNIDKSLNKIHLTPSPTLRTSSKPKVDNNIFKEQRVLQDINPNVVAARLPPMSKGTYHINRIF